jgi:adenosyl cobinamide kinase/adenosyl cobinamide phosphate guanylyltransferase
MQFLAIKKHQRPRKDGRPHAQAFVIKKNRKFGDVLEQKGISTKKPVLITGAHASGKSYWLDRLHKDAARVWAQIDAQPLYLSAVRPLSAWTDTKFLEIWWAARDNPDDDRHWTKLKAWERVDRLPLYLKETGAVLFIDDAHNLSGRKLKLTQDCVRAAKIWVMAAADEGRIAPGLRKDVLALEPQTFRLDSEVAYDATSIIMWLLMLACLMGGAYEVAAVLGGLKMLAGGSRATKQS